MSRKLAASTRRSSRPNSPSPVLWTSRRCTIPAGPQASADLKPEQSIDEARKALLKNIEDFAANPPTQEEVDRAKARILKNYRPHALLTPREWPLSLAAISARATGVTFFLEREEIAKVDPGRRPARRQGIPQVAPTAPSASSFPPQPPTVPRSPPHPLPPMRFKDFKGGEAEGARRGL